MGNEQSNEIKRIKEREKRDAVIDGKIFKITDRFTGKEFEEMLLKHADFGKFNSEELLLFKKELIHYFLDDVKGRFFSIKCVDCAPFNSYQKGDYVKIKLKVGATWLDIVREDLISLNQMFMSHIFDDVNEIRKVEGA